MRRFAVLCCSLLLFVAVTGAFHYGWSQEVTASITGTVTDPSGAAVPGATVTATSVERGIAYTATSNGSGLYRIPQLPVGSYTVKTEKSGFAVASVPAFVLTLNQVAQIDITMKVGQASETVEVTGAAPVMETQTTQVDTIVNAATNDNMPLASRNYVQLTLLAPGAVSTDPSSFNNGNNTGGYGGRPLINGNREQANNFLLDGMDNNQVSDNLLGYTPAPDAIEEFNLITSNAPAEFGNFEGGIVSATIKSGTNQYHGDIWEFFRNDKLNAHNWADGFGPNGTVLPKARTRWNMFGGTFGGPIIKNKLFFFADYQAQRFDVPASSQNDTIFTAAEQGGDFSALCTDPSKGGSFSGGICTGGTGIQLYNPCASFAAPCTPTSAPATTRQPFMNNQIPAAMISPVASALFASSLYPTPNSTALQSNTVNTLASAENVDQGDLKIDFKATQRDSISYRFTRAYQNNPTNNSFALLGNSYATTPIYNTVGDWTHTIGNNLVNDARFGWSHITLNSGNSFASSVGNFGDTLGIGNGNPASVDGLLALNFSSVLTNLGQSEQTQHFDDHVWEVEDALSWNHGRHTFKFGGQWWRQILTTFYAGNNGELGLMNFDGRFTASAVSNPNTNTGDGGADFFLGLDFEYGRGISTVKNWNQSANIIGVYAQDTWRVTNRLTLNLGLRYDAHTPWIEDNNQQANYNLATGNIDLAGQNGASKALYNGVYGGKDFQPRIGFAWTPAALGDKTVIRGAFTISSYLEGTGTNLRLPLNPPFTPPEIDQTSASNASLPQQNTSSGIVAPPAASCAAPDYACYTSSFLRIWDPKVQPAIADQWNLTIQHQLAPTTTFQVGYVGQKGTHLMVPFDYAQRLLLPNSSCATPPCTANSPYFAANPGLYSVLGGGTPTSDATGAQVSGTKSNGNMKYNSLQAILQKQMSQGLQGQVSYTFSKCMSDSTGYYGAWNNALSASAYWQNVYDQRAEWAPCYYDATHVLSAYAIYDLPFGRGKMFAQNASRAVNEVIGGWAISPIVSWRTGWPMTITGVKDESGTFSRGPRANCDSGLPSIVNKPIQGVGIQWFDNTGQFTTPSLGSFGDCSPQLSGLRTPRFADVDMSLHKDFPINERFRLQFRTDWVNAFNHVQYNAPSPSLGSGLGQITSAQPPRNIQLALKLYY